MTRDHFQVLIGMIVSRTFKEERSNEARAASRSACLGPWPRIFPTFPEPAYPFRQMRPARAPTGAGRADRTPASTRSLRSRAPASASDALRLPPPSTPAKKKKKVKGRQSGPAARGSPTSTKPAQTTPPRPTGTPRPIRRRAARINEGGGAGGGLFERVLPAVAFSISNTVLGSAAKDSNRCRPRGALDRALVEPYRLRRSSRP